MDPKPAASTVPSAKPDREPWQRVPLVHVPASKAFFKLLKMSDAVPVVLPPTDQKKRERTRQAEASLGIASSVYAYVGYAGPTFGTIAILFDMECSRSCDGTTTPFDTGGLHCGYIRATFPLHTERQRREYFQTNSRPMAHLGQHFYAFLNVSYAGGPIPYVEGHRPDRDDDSGRHHHPDNEREAWTWEAQASRLSLSAALALYLAPDEFEAVMRELRYRTVHPIWLTLMAENRIRKADVLNPGGVSRWVEQEIVTWLQPAAS